MIVAQISYPQNQLFPGLDTSFTNHFLALFVGTMQIGTSGMYTFWTVSDDGSDVSIDGVRIINNDGFHGTITKSGEMYLNQGTAVIRVRYMQNSGGKALHVHWEGPGIEKQLLGGSSVIADADLRVLGRVQLPFVPSLTLDVPAGVDVNTEYQGTDIRCQQQADFTPGACFALCIIETGCHSYTFKRSSMGQPACCLKSSLKEDSVLREDVDCVSGVAIRTGSGLASENDMPCHAMT